MKTFLKIIIPLLVVGLIVYYSFRKITPVDDTKKVYISCNSYNSSYELYSGTNFKFSEKNNACYLEIEVMNVDRTYLKLKANKFLYSLDGNGKIDEDAISKDIFDTTDSTLTLYSYDKKTKFTFEYK